MEKAFAKVEEVGTIKVYADNRIEFLKYTVLGIIMPIMKIAGSIKKRNRSIL